MYMREIAAATPQSGIEALRRYAEGVGAIAPDGKGGLVPVAVADVEGNHNLVPVGLRDRLSLVDKG